MTELAVPSALELLGNLITGVDCSRLLALGLAADLHPRFGLAPERDLADVIGNARVTARDLADARDLAHIIYGDRDLTNSLASACASADGLASDLAAARDHDRATRGTAIDPRLTYDRALASTRDYADGRNRARLSALALAKDLALARNLATDLASNFSFNIARNLANAADRDTEERDDRASPMHAARPAARVVAWTAACLLPRRDRIRYDLEYRSELADLAAAGKSRLQQLRHAGGLLVRAPLLRVDLTMARRRKVAK